MKCHSTITDGVITLPHSVSAHGNLASTPTAINAVCSWVCLHDVSTGEISKSQDPDTKEFIGPNRVWPGGLNMSRTIGDPQAPQVCTCSCEWIRGMYESYSKPAGGAKRQNRDVYPAHSGFVKPLCVECRQPSSCSSGSTHQQQHACGYEKLPAEGQGPALRMWLHSCCLLNPVNNHTAAGRLSAAVPRTHGCPAACCGICSAPPPPPPPQVIAVPEVRHVTLPTTGGRIIIASDGVWDHMQPKSMIHQVSGVVAHVIGSLVATLQVLWLSIGAESCRLPLMLATCTGSLPRSGCWEVVWY